MALDVISPIWIGSPNFWTGRRGQRPEAIVIHIAEGTAASVDSWFHATDSQVSAHYLVTQAGRVHQYVREEDAAWHAGRIDKPTWTGLKKRADGTYISPNTYTVGIEHEGQDASPWPDVMYVRSAMLLAELHVRWGIPIDRAHVVGHREIYSLKTCPGSVVDLTRLVGLARALVGLP